MNALMPDTELHGLRRRTTDQWEGFSEIDRAIAENRLTAYRWKKAWADPLARAGLIAIFIIFAAFVAFAVWQDVL